MLLGWYSTNLVQYLGAADFSLGGSIHCRKFVCGGCSVDRLVPSQARGISSLAWSATVFASSCLAVASPAMQLFMWTARGAAALCPRAAPVLAF